MRIFKKFMSLCLFLFSISTLAYTLAQTPPKTISVISNEVTVASFDVPASTKIEVSAEHQATNADKTKTDFKGKARMSLTFTSGEVMHINAEELQIISRAEAGLAY